MPLDRQAIEAMQQTLRDGVKIAVVRDLFATPWQIVEQMIDWAGLPRDSAPPYLRILEPSGGTGAILSRLRACDNKVVVEKDPRLFLDLVRRCVKSGTHYFEGDFLAQTPQDLGGKFDCVLMNPPFSDGNDVRHILHATQFLKPTGCLVAICANGSRQVEKLRERCCSRWEELPEGTFSGTNVRTVMLRIEG